MPLFEYICRTCGKEFEELVCAGDQPQCPACASQDLEKLFSTFVSPGMSGPSSKSSCGSCPPGHSCSSCSCH